MRILGRQRQQQDEGIVAAQRHLGLSQPRFRTGFDPYPSVFTAQTSPLNDQRTVVTLQVKQMTGSMHSIKALEGGLTTA